jgi:DNA-binding NarL/FixJ family response regulator
MIGKFQMTKPRVLLADDQTFLLQACQKMLEGDYEIPAVFTDGRALLDAAPGLKPDIIVLEIGMSLLHGLDAGRMLKQRIPNVKLIYLTMYTDPDLAREAIRIGASAYLLKTSAASELMKAIREALRDKVYVTPAIARAMQDSSIQNPGGKHASKDLTLRQREVVQLLAEGCTMKEAACILGLATRTVAFHKYRIMEHLGLKSSAELIQFAVSHHLVMPRLEFSPING